MFTEILLIILLIAVLAFWSDSLKAQESALYAVKLYCKKMDLQLLDDYVALHKSWPMIDPQGKFTLYRQYAFEFSATGIDRCSGQVWMFGKNIQKITVDVHPDP